MYVSVFACAVTFPIVYLSIDPTPANLTVVMVTGFIVAAFGCMMILFVPKTHFILTGHDVDENFEIVKVNNSDGTPLTAAQVISTKIRKSRSNGSSKDHAAVAPIHTTIATRSWRDRGRWSNRSSLTGVFQSRRVTALLGGVRALQFRSQRNALEGVVAGQTPVAREEKE